MGESGVELVRVRAAVHLSGLRLGAVARVDPSDPYIASCLEAGFLVRLPPPEPARDG